MTGPSVRAFIRNSRSGRALCLLLLMSYVSTCVICAPAYANDPTLGSHRYQNGRLIHTRHGCADVHPATHGWWENFNDWTDHVCKGVRSDVDRAKHVWDAAIACAPLILPDMAVDARGVFGSLIGQALLWMAIAVLAYAAGAVIGGIVGGLSSVGVGAAAGASLGFKIAGIFLQWLGIGLLMRFVLHYLGDMIPSLWTGIRSAWYSDEWGASRAGGMNAAQWMVNAENWMAHGVSLFGVAVVLAFAARAMTKGAGALKSTLKTMKGVKVTEAYPAGLVRSFVHDQSEANGWFLTKEISILQWLAEFRKIHSWKLPVSTKKGTQSADCLSGVVETGDPMNVIPAYGQVATELKTLESSSKGAIEDRLKDAGKQTIASGGGPGVCVMDLRGAAGATREGVRDILDNWWKSTGTSGNGADKLDLPGNRLSFALIILEDSVAEGSYVSAGQWPAQWGEP